MEDTAKLCYGDECFELPVVKGSEDERAVDISRLRAMSNLVTLDIGYKNTGATQSAITFLNGEQGILRYRGYSIEELCEKSTFLEVAYLLIMGELPSAKEFQKFENDIRMRTLVHEDMRKIFDGFPATAHPMGLVSSLVCSLTAFYPESLDPQRSPEAIYLTVIRLLAKLPTIAAWAYKNSLRHPVNYPDNNLGYCANFLKMMFALPTQEYQNNPIVEKALDQLLILHADHEQNCSTSTVRLVGSSHASLYAAIAAGMNALWGNRHGGANQAVMEMLDEILANGGDVKKYVLKAKDKNDPFRLMGFGHRVYKNFDPRAKIIKKSCDDVLESLGINDPTLEIAKELEYAALNDDYFKERKLYPNVDFYSGIIYRAIKIPVEMFTVMFAFGRLPGWIAQWREMRQQNQPIGRPRQIYTGANLRKYNS